MKKVIVVLLAIAALTLSACQYVEAGGVSVHISTPGIHIGFSDIGRSHHVTHRSYGTRIVRYNNCGHVIERHYRGRCGHNDHYARRHYRGHDRYDRHRPVYYDRGRLYNPYKRSRAANHREIHVRDRVLREGGEW